ncbi:hypothetical protein ACWDSL_37305 [Streptomyces sp. NPDC000941]
MKVRLLLVPPGVTTFTWAAPGAEDGAVMVIWGGGVDGEEGGRVRAEQHLCGAGVGPDRRGRPEGGTVARAARRAVDALLRGVVAYSSTH